MGAAGTWSYRPGGLLLLVAMALGVMSHGKAKDYSFTAWVLAGVGMAMLYPEAFVSWGGFKLELLIIPLTQLIMFGMGTTLSLTDFVRIAKEPWPILLGVVLQYAVMPIVGYFIALMFGFEGELAAGIVLIGSVSGGVASNLITYLAKGKVALSVTMTFLSTMISPFATPFLMEVLAGTFVPIDPVQMMLSILNMIIVPVVAGLVAHEVLYSHRSWAHSKNKLSLLAAVSTVFTAAVVLLGQNLLGALYGGLIMGGTLITLITLSKMVISVFLGRSNAWMDNLLPFLSMAGIWMVLVIIIAQTYQVLMAVGVLLLAAAIFHNTIGYTLGYWGSRGFGYVLGRAGYRLGLFATAQSRISESESRTIAIEVGMQNGGMASGLAIDVLHSYAAALPPNIFGTWMNISGSVLANYWKQRPITEAVANTPEGQVPAISQSDDT